jgi:hypothetical protein
MNDLFMSEECDLIIRKKNLKKVDDSNNNFLKNLILKRIQSFSDDWNFANNSVARVGGMDITDYLGSRVTLDLIAGIKYAIVETLTREGIIKESDILMSDLPIDKNRLMLQISISTNYQGYNKSLGLQIFYDLRQNRLVPKILDEAENNSWPT